MDLATWKKLNQDLADTVAEINRLFNSDLSWEQKYDQIFALNAAVFRPAREALGFDLDYYDPDMDYEDDVRAFVDAVNQKFPSHPVTEST